VRPLTPWNAPIPPITLLRFMPSAVRAQNLLAEARANDGKIDANELDRIMIQLRDGGGLDDAERAALLIASKGPGFDDATRELLLKHITAMGQHNAWVNIEVAGQVASIEGRYATMSTDVPGLSARLGMFDSTFSLKGQATADGVLKMTIEGREVSVAVKAGDQPAAIFEKLKDQLPSGVTGLTFGGDVQPYDPENFRPNATSDGRGAAHMALYKPEALGLREGETPMRVVVTGYGPFQGITDNPSAAMAQRLAEQGVPGAIVEYKRLDVTTASVDKFMREMKSSPPDVILSLGRGSDAKIETQPENWLTGHARDGAGHMLHERRIDRDFSKHESIATDLPLAVISTSLGPNSEIKMSVGGTHDRSGYLCNYLGYNLANTFGDAKDPQNHTAAGFMHIEETTSDVPVAKVLEAVTANQLDTRRQAYVP